MSTQDLNPPCGHCGGRIRRPDGRCALCGELPEGSASPTDPLVGQIVADRFRIQGLLGQGGVGRVYRAQQVNLDRPAALKLLHPSLATSAEQKARFEREARAASRLNHPGVVTVYDFGEWEGQLYIAMELLSGRSLAAVLDEEYPLENERTVALLVQVCDVLALAHETGVLHRDLKPENIMVQVDAQGQERIKLVDFGLAILHDGPSMQRLTQEGIVSGTPAYMSPEQCRGKGVDERSDLYSLGVVLYEMVAGDVPFQSESPMEVLVQHLFNAPPPPSAVAGEVPVHPELERIAMVALSKAPAERPSSAHAFRALLDGALNPVVPHGGRANELRPPITRMERADAAGLARPPARTLQERPDLPFAPAVLVVEPAPSAPGSLYTLLQANQVVCDTATDLDAASVKVLQRRPGAVVVDLRPAPSRLLGELERVMHAGTLVGARVAVVGDEANLEAMTRALGLGIAHYVPAAAVSEKLPGIVFRMQKKALRRRAREMK